ncbi:MAG: 30S ribosomal protein S20 [Chlamydiae bacterium]|nr:30S ribosomal protein S20 [Chlamydiota bacterium]
MAEEKAKTQKIKRPSAKKRNIQSEKNRLRNRSHRSSVLTAVRSFEASLTQKESAEAVKEKLSQIYSLMDQGVKKGIYKVNKAARTKARLTARTASL